MCKPPIIKTPCKNFTFRKDSMQGLLGKERMTEILESYRFVCHKTTHKKSSDIKKCPGFMIIQDSSSLALRYSKALKIDLNLKGQDLIFENKKDCIIHHTY